MRKIYLFIFTVFLLNVANAQWATSVRSGAGTNVYTSFTFDKDNNPVVVGGAKDFSGGKPNCLAFMKHDRESGASKLIKTFNGNTNSEAYRMYLDAEGNIYFFGTFMDRIAFGTDTLFTYDRVYWNRSNYLLAKFDSEGNHLWSKKFGKRAGVGLDNIVDAHILNNKFYVMMYFAGDSVLYGDNLVEKLPQNPVYNFNYCLMKIDLNDGSLQTFKNIGANYYTNPKMFAVKADGEYEFGTISTGQTNNFLVSTFTDAGVPAPKCSVEYKESVRLKGNTIQSVHYLNGNYYMLIVNNQTQTGGSVYGTDSVNVLLSPYNLRTGAVIRFDETMKFVKAVRFHWRDKNPLIRISNNKIVVPSRFSNTMFIEADSMVCRNNQQAWAVMAFNDDLSIADTFQVNTANTSGGSFEVHDAKYDRNGNLYVQLVHNKDIQFYGTLVKAALKSWDHLTVLVRMGDAIGTGLKSEALAARADVYPNPASDLITVGVSGLRYIAVHDLSGREVMRADDTSTIQVSSLPQGLYFIKAFDGTTHYQAKFIKN
jgi:hypothetical protein